MNRKIKIIFFDLGDTLVDMSISRRALDFGIKGVLPGKVITDELLVKWERESYITFEYYFKKGEFYTVRGLQEISLKKVLLGEGVDLEDHKIDDIINKFWQYLIKNCQFYDDVLPILSKLVQDQFDLGLITNADEEYVNGILKKHNLDSIFKIKVISSVLKSYKPGLLIFKRALELAKCLPNEAIYVGDSFTDICGAKKLGLITVLIHRNKSIESMAEIKPDFEINSLFKLNAIANNILSEENK